MEKQNGKTDLISVTQTKGGFEVVDFRLLKRPLVSEGKPDHIYVGTIKNLVMGMECMDIEVTWDAEGKCYNDSRKDCYIDVTNG